MNRSELITTLSDQTGVSKKVISAVLNAFAETVGEVVAKGDEKVALPGFVTFERAHRAARSARNPQTGEPIQIPAGYTVKVSAGTTLKRAASGS